MIEFTIKEDTCMKKYILLLLCLSVLALAACAADVGANLPENDASQDVEPVEPQENLPATDSPNTDAVENEIVLLPCIDNGVTFTSLSEMKEQLTAMKALPVTDARYEEYAVLNTQELQYYYQPNLPEEFELVHVEVFPNLFIYTYEIPGKTGIVDVHISRIPESDPLLDIEKVTKQLRWKGYVFTGNTNWADLYFAAPGGYLVRFSASKDLLRELGVYETRKDAMMEWCSLENIETVRINTDHIIE